MTQDELNALEALEQSATPGPWRWYCPDRGHQDDLVVTDSPAYAGTSDDLHRDFVASTECRFDEIGSGNAAFIATIRNVVPALIAAARENAALRAALAQAQEALAPIVAGMEDDPDYGPTVRMSAISHENMTRARSVLDAILKVLRS